MTRATTAERTWARRLQVDPRAVAAALEEARREFARLERYGVRFGDCVVLAPPVARARRLAEMTAASRRRVRETLDARSRILLGRPRYELHERISRREPGRVLRLAERRAVAARLRSPLGESVRAVRAAIVRRTGGAW